MNHLIKSLTGMGGMTDQMIATDFLISVKSGIRNLAFAITETATPELRETIRQQLRDAIETHENITNFMVNKGYYHPNDMGEQEKMELTITETTLKLTD